MFPNDPLQWEDTDLDGWGDNYGWVNSTIADETDVGNLITIRDQWGDAFPLDPSQWSDTDGDGFGDNNTGRLPMHSRLDHHSGLIPTVMATVTIRN